MVRLQKIIITGLIAYSVVSSLSVYPHHLSYFNDFVGGPNGGYRHLVGSSLNWGQDLLLTERWVGARAGSAVPVRLGYSVGYPSRSIVASEDVYQADGLQGQAGGRFDVVFCPDQVVDEEWISAVGLEVDRLDGLGFCRVGYTGFVVEVPLEGVRLVR